MARFAPEPLACSNILGRLAKLGVEIWESLYRCLRGFVRISCVSENKNCKSEQKDEMKKLAKFCSAEQGDQSGLIFADWANVFNGQL
jgi:hypothetical protein